MLSGDSAALFHTAFVSDSGIGPFASSTPSGLTPQQIRHAYGFDQVALGGVAGDGSGQTIAIIDPFDSPTIAGDLQAFDAKFGLPDPPSFVRVAQDGSTNYPVTDPNAGHSTVTWELETALDVEWAHALAPRANLLLVEANSTDPSDLLTAAVNYARNLPGVSVVSMSFGRSEIPAEVSYDSLFATPTGHNGVTFLAATGDSGQPAAYPAFSPDVIAVGGTALTVDDVGNYLGESGWSGSGGGISTVESQPSFQNPMVKLFSTTQRTAPDVAFNAASGVAVYDSWDFGASTPWMSVGGTSVACPSWGALIAIADQARVAAGMTTLDGPTQTLPALYAMPSANFNDITTGNNGNQRRTGLRPRHRPRLAEGPPRRERSGRRSRVELARGRLVGEHAADRYCNHIRQRLRPEQHSGRRFRGQRPNRGLLHAVQRDNRHVPLQHESRHRPGTAVDVHPRRRSHLAVQRRSAGGLLRVVSV